MMRGTHAENKAFLRFAYGMIEEKFAKKDIFLWNTDWKLLATILTHCVNDDELTPEKICCGLSTIAQEMAEAYAEWK